MRYTFSLLIALLGFTTLALTIQPASAEQSTARLLIIGDSISAGYGVPLEQQWPKMLEQSLQQEVPQIDVITAAISGDTTSGGRNRLPKLLKEFHPDMVMIALGGNDALRGTPLNLVENNLNAMTQMAIDSGAQVLLAGMQIPPNYGPAYTERFRAIYPNIAEQKNTFLIPFFLDKIATVEGMMQADGIHPNASAQPILVQHVLDALKPWLAEIKSQK
ncbi:MAG: arylesterase [Oleibacter sp.]|nr:arylesterase [Thalassolituus sp.]